MNGIEIYWDMRIVGKTVITREDAGSKVTFFDDDNLFVQSNSTIKELTGPSFSRLGRFNGKTRWIRFRVE